MRGHTIILTGAAGFIGSHVAPALARAGARVIGVDNFDPYYPRAIKESNLRQARATAGPTFEFVEADICDAAAMKSLAEKARGGGLIHLAGKAGVRPSLVDPAGYARANVLGTSVLLWAASQAGLKRAVIASSSSVYGNCPRAPFSEEMDVNQPISPYAATKRACEVMAFTHHHQTGMPTACLRFFTVYGPRQRPDLAIALFLGCVSRGEAIPVFGDGSMSRDYTYIDDVVSGVLAAYERIESHGYRVWNLGSDRPVSLRDMIVTIGRVAGREPKIDRRPVPPGDVERTWADLTRSAAELGYRATTAFEEGVRRQWAAANAL